MCGIWALISQNSITDLDRLFKSFMKTKNRGPDFTNFQLIGESLILGFHRLAIMDTSPIGNQPFVDVDKTGKSTYVICNGEIYDHKNLIKKYDLKTLSTSDCEIILPLYKKIGVDNLVKLLGSEFAFIIVEIDSNGKMKLTAGRDPIGVRPLFFSFDGNSLCLSSEAKGLTDIFDNVQVFKPGHYMIYEDNKLSFTEYYSYVYKQLTPTPSLDDIHAMIRLKFTNAVRRRLESDKEVGFLLSGGLDSSLVCSVAKSLLPSKRFPVFTISFPGGTDLPYAKKVAEYLDLDHRIIELTPEDALKELDETIYAIESFDITTIRASTMQRLVAKYIQKHTDVKVLQCGELSDELAAGYLYSHFAPSIQALHDDNVRLVKDVHMFDGLRTDRTMAYHGLEVRLPFADHEFVDYYLSIDPSLRAPQQGLEKYLLRKSFDVNCDSLGKKYLPDVITNRVKQAFSDSVSSREESWYQLIQNHINTVVSDEEFQAQKDKYQHCTPFTKESYYYRKKFCEYFGDNHSNLIPYFWMPKWIESNDPSARTLKICKD